MCKYLLKAIPNGGWRSRSEAGKLKAEGVVAGAWDLELCVPYLNERNWDSSENDRSNFPDERYWEIIPGLILEVKRPDQRNSRNGGLTPEQVAYGEAMADQGWRRAVCYSAQEIFEAVKNHFS